MKKVLVIGAAISGTAVSRLLNEKGYDVTLTDKGQIVDKAQLEEKGIHVYDQGNPDFLLTDEYEFVVKNPGIPYFVPFVRYFVEKKIPIYNEIEVALWYAPKFQVGAITGTNGKTTTTALLGELLKRKGGYSSTAGNIGEALSEIVMKHEQDTMDIALEIAAFQLVGCEKFHPLVSVCMNLTPDHLDYFGNLEDYYQAKMRIYQNQREDDWFLRNLDDENIVRFAQNIPCKVIDFSLHQKADLYLDKEGRIMLGDECLFTRDDLKLPGLHNVQNAMVAACMAYKMGLTPDEIRQGIREFNGVEHRIEYCGEINQVRYYNDSKGTNVDATRVALKAFDEPIHLLAGGYDKKTGFDEIRPYLSQVKTMYVYGDTKMQLKELMQNCVVCDTMLEALQKAYENAKPHEVVLLSPMCASWDQFKNYEQRGQMFKEKVQSLASASSNLKRNGL